MTLKKTKKKTVDLKNYLKITIQHKYREEGKSVLRCVQFSSQTQAFPLIREIQSALLYFLMQPFSMPPRVHSVTFRNHTWPGSAGGLVCFLPSYSSAPAHAPLPVKEEGQVKFLQGLNVKRAMLFK